MSEQTAAASGERVAVEIPAPIGFGAINGTILRWTLSGTGAMLPLFVVAQAVLAAAVIIGLGLLIPDIDSAAAQYLSSGAPTVLIMAIGLVMVPQGTSQSRMNGAFMYQRALPVPRSILMLNDLIVWLVMALPGVAVAVIVSLMRYDFTFSFNWPLLVGGSVLAALMAISIGYAMGVLLRPMPAQLLSQVLVFFVLLFSPVISPESRFPSWLRSVHEVLPIQSAGDMIRAGLLSDTFSTGWQDALIVAAWCALGLLISIRALVRRG